MESRFSVPKSILIIALPVCRRRMIMAISFIFHNEQDLQPWVNIVKTRALIQCLLIMSERSCPIMVPLGK
jgi:hypothetical protein